MESDQNKIGSTHTSAVVVLGFSACLSSIESWHYPIVTYYRNEIWEAEATALCALAFVMLCLYCIFNKKYILRNLMTSGIAAAFMSLSLLLRFSLVQASPNLEPLSFAFSHLHLFFGSIMIYVWVEEMLRSSTLTPMGVAASLLTTAAIQMLSSLLVDPVSQGMCAILPIVSFLLLMMQRRSDAENKTLTFWKNHDQHKSLGSFGLPEIKAAAMISLTTLLVGWLVFNLHSSWYFTGPDEWSTIEHSLASVTGTLIACGVLLIIGKRPNDKLILLAIVLLFALALYFLALQVSGIGKMLYLVLYIGGLKLAVIYILFAATKIQGIQAQVASFCLGYAGYRIGIAAPPLLHEFLSFRIGADGLLNIAILIALAGITFFQIVKGVKKASGEAGESTEAKNSNASENDESEIKEMAFYFYLGKRFGLTPRESEILPFLCSMRNADSISSELSIARSTVKTHTQNIYSKLGVHSQAELAESIKEYRESF